MKTRSPSVQASALEHSAHSMLGLTPLVNEMTQQGISVEAMLVGTGLLPEQLNDPKAMMTVDQKVKIFRNVRRLSAIPDIGLRAGQRQRLSDFGIYGYALASSSTFGEAVLTGVKHVKLAGPVLEKRFRVVGNTAIFEGQDILNLGDVLPLSTEFWLSSILSLGRSILEAPFPNRLLKLPYAKPTYASAYESLFNCPVLFDTDVMEWHFDAAVLNHPCPNANPITADLCKQFCEKWVSSFPDEDDLVRRIRTACINTKGHFPNAEEVARRVGMSQRTLQRRLSLAGKPFHAIIDEVRSSLAKEYLDSSTLTIAEVAERTGFSEPSSFRKAFMRWTGDSPSNYRLRALSEN